MSQIDSHIRLIQEKLAGEGSEFSYEEVEEVFKALRDASLKLIVTNVPRAVFTNDTARNAFEDHFRSYDPHSTFFYLSSFNRAQVYMERPEAALCARLQSQGWKLPRDRAVSSLPEGQTTEDVLGEGINCFIDHVDEEDISPNSSEDDLHNSECNCDMTTESMPLGDENQLIDSKKDPSVNQEFRVIEMMGKLKPKDGNDDLESDRPFSRQHLPSEPRSDSSGPRDFPLDYRRSATECESTSEASGDDLATSAITGASRACAHKPSCPKYRETSKTSHRMKHLAPPKPPRLFLLSPPASPPVGWEPKKEAEPVINYELLEALASLAPGEAFELYPRDAAGRHPSIVITPCETQHSTGSRPQIIQTRCPERKSS